MDKNSRVAMQERGLDILSMAPKGFEFTDTFFLYTSGEIGPYDVQSGGVQCRAGDFLTATRDMASLVSNMSSGIEVVAGGETRDWIFSIPTALELGLAHTMIYKNGKVVGANMKGRRVALVSDLNNEGTSPRDYWVPTIKKEGGVCKNVFFYVDRMEKGVGVVDKLGLQREAVVPLDAHAWDHLQARGVVSPEVYRSLRARLEDQDSWAKNMLRSDAGFNRYASMMADDGTREKAMKITRIYDEKFPGLEDELTNRLAERD